MNTWIRIEIKARDEFWGKAVIVEWKDQYPDRPLNNDPGSRYLMIEVAWLDDLKRVAGDCFSEIVVAPADPSRRFWLSHFTRPWQH